MPESELARLRREFPQHEILHAVDSDSTAEAIRDVEVAYSSRITAEHFAQADRLRWIHSNAAGVGSMLFPALLNSDVVLTNSRGVGAPFIAEHTIAVTLALFRSLPFTLQRQAGRHWAMEEYEGERSIRTLRDARVLIVGLGAIGSDVARLCAAFGSHVIGIRRRLDEPLPEGVHAVVGPDRLPDELALADVVVVAAPHTAETSNLIGAPELALMKQDAVLVNVSRGKLVDERALVEALDRGRLRGAALDVFQHEPLDPASPLWAHPRVLITPHVSGHHEHYWRNTVDLFAENLRRYERGEPLRNVVDKHAGY